MCNNGSTVVEINWEIFVFKIFVLKIFVLFGEYKKF